MAALLKAFAFFPLTLLATACAAQGPSSWSEDEAKAVDVCMNMAMTEFPYLWPDDLHKGPELADIDQSIFKRSGKGRFEFLFPAIGDEYEFAFMCEGNTSDRKITKIVSGKPGLNNSISTNRSY